MHRKLSIRTVSFSFTESSANYDDAIQTVQAKPQPPKNSDISTATPGCCFDNLVNMAPNCVRQCISDMSACKQHADPERVRSLLQQSDDMPVAAWCVTHGKECRVVHSDTHSWQHLHGHSSFGKRCGMAGPHTKIFYIWAAVMRQMRPKVIIAENVTQFGLQPHERELGDIYACV